MSEPKIRLTQISPSATGTDSISGNVTITNDLTVGGNLTVSGDTTTLNVQTLLVEDNEIILNSNVTGSPTLNASVTVNRGSSSNAFLLWNEGTDKWGWSDDGNTVTEFATAVLKTGDTMTGLLNVASDLVVTGNVGIGVDSPSHKLDINGVINSNTSPSAYFGVGEGAPQFAFGWANNSIYHRLRSIGGGNDGFTIELKNALTSMEIANTPSYIAFKTDGANERLRIDANGNIGIGTSSPSAQLEVSRSATDGYSTIRWSNKGASGRTYEIGLGGSTSAAGFANNLYFYDSTAGATRMVIDASGNLGLGVTPPAWISGWRALQLGGSSGNAGSVYANAGGTTGLIGLAQNWFYDGSVNKYLTSAAAADFYLFEGTCVWRTAASGTAGNTVTLTERARITSGGALLVGTTNVPTVTGGSVFVLNNTIFISGSQALNSPYTQNLQIDIVWNAWGDNNVVGLVEIDVTMREYTSTGGVAFGRIFATNSGAGATFATFNTTNITTSQCTVTAASGGNYTLRITINPSNNTDRMAYLIKIPGSVGGTGVNVASVTASLV